MGTHQRRTQRLEAFYSARAMDFGTMLSLVDRVLTTCSLHVDAETMTPLRAEIQDIVDLAMKRDWDTMKQRATPGGVFHEP